ncbi:30S ribosomal protein S2 [Candidatus Collierbacteria bacterium RIFOXYD1_FULL_40_9]|uniref:Small ribosomal subunit protein uS2 n=1 Tax=Candidatus Collierbacteria bacterium RIFOXYD1_FULL_40_9 TaxID=1817731 RepID=A0A1F5FV24_9BACT|nr:MAG: 30S ribosomal protein S2 [Candidatus Collierbacteria bacterium RIFOXYD1_FULL_40_9]
MTAEDLFDAGAHFGHVVKKWNPKMKKYLWGAMNGIHIFDLEKTIAGLNEACKTLTHLASTGKRIVMVGTKRQAKQMVEDEAKRIGVPFITQRWMGGLITNWKQVKQTIDRLNKLKKDKEEGNLKKYTKKEQVLFDKEIIKLERVVGGISTLKEAPEVVVVIDTHKERLVVREASSKNVTIIGLVDSNANPDKVNLVIPMNDDSAKGLEIVIAALGKAIENGLKSK